ncbi:hypothetical protein NDU88_006171 [Pleurodeles waltl]|uniref:Uncharacterized protein n=1 Tax=Pleurodeles waltl TaxID=8319 RepID=A0AAV7LRP1_PLEWA|nr:hypothetical protein NDU88_006171 [Pleurodeles waltl]
MRRADKQAVKSAKCASSVQEGYLAPGVRRRSTVTGALPQPCSRHTSPGAAERLLHKLRGLHRSGPQHQLWRHPADCAATVQFSQRSITAALPVPREPWCSVVPASQALTQPCFCGKSPAAAPLPPHELRSGGPAHRSCHALRCSPAPETPALLLSYPSHTGFCGAVLLLSQQVPRTGAVRLWVCVTLGLVAHEAPCCPTGVPAAGPTQQEYPAARAASPRSARSNNAG